MQADYFSMEVFMELFILCFLSGAAGAASSVLFFAFKKKRNEHKWKKIFEPYLTGETWFATGENFDTFHGSTKTRYIEAEFARCTRGLGQLLPDENVRVRIPNVGSPRYGDAFFLRMRSPMDPQPPHYENIGCHLFADSQGWTQVSR